jgi:NitT/TauT family transport system ATP-binding protein
VIYMIPNAKLKIAGLNFEYSDIKNKSHCTALKNVNLAVSEGEFVSIIGPSGCGKSTLLYVIDGLLKPKNGQIFIDGKPVSRPGRDRALVFQSPSLLPWRTVLRNVTYGLEMLNVNKKEAEAKALELIKTVGLSGFERYHPHALSGGMQQRANLARALALDPEILLMDEPFAALDAQTREEMQLELLRVHRETRKTIFFVTHQIDEAVYLSDRVIVLSGRPGTVKSMIWIDIDRARPMSAKKTAKFHEFEDLLRNELETNREPLTLSSAS